MLLGPRNQDSKSPSEKVSGLGFEGTLLCGVLRGGEAFACAAQVTETLLGDLLLAVGTSSIPCGASTCRVHDSPARRDVRRQFVTDPGWP